MTEPLASSNGVTRPGSTASSASGGWALPLAVLVVGMFMSVLDTSIVNVALPTLQNDFSASIQDVQWIVTAYTLTLGVVVPVTAWLGDRFGLRRVYNLALLGFAASSALCGLAWDLNSLVVFRVVQAIPGGILPAITLTMLYRIVPRGQLGAAMGMYGLGVVFAPAVGPTLGGYLVEYVNWRLIFFVNVPVGVLGAIAAMLVLPGFPRMPSRRFDVLGFLTVAGGLFALLLAVSKGEDWGWGSYQVLGLLCFSVLSLALFVVIELEVSHPLLDVRVFSYRAYAQSLMLLSVLMVVLFGALYYVPQFLQVAQGWGALDSGLSLLPQAAVMGLLMPVAGRLYDRFGPRWPVFFGLLIVAIANYLLHTLTIDTPRAHLIWLLAFLAVGLGLSMMPIMTGGIAVIPMSLSNTASAYNNVVRNVAGSLGVAMLTAILTIQQAQMMTGRAALLPSATPTPALGPPGTPDWMGSYALYRQVNLQVFVDAIDNIFLIGAVMAAVAALGALTLRSGPAPASPPVAPAAAASLAAEGAPVEAVLAGDGAEAGGALRSARNGRAGGAGG